MGGNRAQGEPLLDLESSLLQEPVLVAKHSAEASTRMHCSQDLNETKRPSKAAKYSGWKASADVLESELKEQQYDGILGRQPYEK